MIFKDRAEAGKKLATLLKGRSEGSAVISLLRGGIVVGHEVAKILKAPHYPLPVAKISSPIQPELAIGALCFDEIYLDKNIIGSLHLSQKAIVSQIKAARSKFQSYLKRFSINKSLFRKLKNKVVILVDDGIATGATVKAAALFLKTLGPKKIVVAAPVAPLEFSSRGLDEAVIFHKDPEMLAISRFYKEFPQLTDLEVKKLL